jgi:hypothetical protein
MSLLETLLCFSILLNVVFYCRYLVSVYRESYYQTKLKMKGVDTSHIDKKGLFEIIFIRR